MVLRLRVSVVDSDPEIWRELEVDADITLAALHDVLQIAFGWRGSHLHQFTDTDPSAARHNLPRIGRVPRTWAPEDPFGEASGDDLPEMDWHLSQVFDGFDGPLYYEYDFGDSWNHQIELVQRITDASNAPKARLLEGERCGPLEDSGGIHGYRDKLQVLADPQHPDHEEVASWVAWVAGPWVPFDPEALDIDHINNEFAARFDRGLGMSGLPTDALPGRPRAVGHGVDTARTPLLPAESAIVDVIERLPVPLRGDLRGLLHRSGALDPPSVDSPTAATMVEPFLWLVRRVGADGIRLTQAGWLPPAVVSDAMSDLGWADHWIGKGNREDQTAPIAALRADATRFGLLRKRNGRLQTTAAARSYLDDPVGMWHKLASAILLRARSEAERDIAVLVALDVVSGRATEAQDGYGYDMSRILFGLEALGWAANPDGGSLPRDAVVMPVYSVLNQLDVLTVFERDGWRRTDVTDGGRAFARAMLHASVV